MPTITLKHCVAVQVYPPGPPSPPMNVHVDATGAPVGGAVDVHVDAPNGPVAGSVPTGQAGDVPIGPTEQVWIHYIKGVGGPKQIELTYELTEV